MLGIIILLALLVCIGIVGKIISRENGHQGGQTIAERHVNRAMATRQPARRQTYAQQRLPPIRKNESMPAAGPTEDTRVLPRPQTEKASIYDYPHCPKCWSVNRQGEAQAVFYVRSGNYYRCKRGHQFLRNGKMRV